MPDAALEPPFPAYDGAEPFIFVSYSHRDARIVLPELKELHARHYRIWYDEGIEPGNEWPEKIEQVLRRSSFLVAFISPSAVASRHVKNEIHLALNLGKRCLAIHICATDLPAGLYMDLLSIQALYKYEMSQPRYWAKVEKALPELVRDRPGQHSQEPSFPTAVLHRKTSIQTRAFPKRSWTFWTVAVGVAVAAVCLLSVGIFSSRIVQTSPEGQSNQMVGAPVIPVGSPPAAQMTPTPQSAMTLDLPATASFISLTPQVEASLQQPAETDRPAPVLIPEAEQPSAPAKNQPPSPKVKVAQAKRKFDSAPAHPSSATNKPALQSTRCQILLKDFQLGDAESAENYRKECAH